MWQNLFAHQWQKQNEYISQKTQELKIYAKISSIQSLFICYKDIKKLRYLSAILC